MIVQATEPSSEISLESSIWHNVHFLIFRFVADRPVKFVAETLATATKALAWRILGEHAFGISSTNWDNAKNVVSGLFGKFW